MKAELLEVSGYDSALRGMRNPLDSWCRGDSGYKFSKDNRDRWYEVGDNDLTLAKKLIKAGTEHRKFLRQIQVWGNLTLPRYIWQELDTYKFGTKNSCSTMHTIGKSPITIEDFYLGDDPIIMTKRHLEDNVIPTINKMRELYVDTKDYRWVKEMKRILPESFLQMRTWNTNYEELRNIYHQRKSHEMNEEWEVVLDFIESLPYAEEFIIGRY